MRDEKKPDSSGHEAARQKTEQITEDAGGYLRRIREEKGLSIREVEEATRISVSNLRAMEAHDYDALPADTFTKGQVALYADFLGLDGVHIATVFLTERDARRGGRKARKRDSAPSLSPKKMAEPSHISSATIAAILLLLIIISFTVFCIYTSWNPFAFLTKRSDRFPASMIGVLQSEEAARQQGAMIMESGRTGTEQEQHESALSELAGANSSRAAEMETRPLVPPYTLTVRFTRSTGIELARDGGKPVRRSFLEGDTANWTAERRLSIRFDRPASAILLLNGRPLPFPEEQDGRWLVKIPATQTDQ
ncbi:MAG TPA: helix-turn-helix domain-containing protein [Desulfobulbus sp.]|nr:helix-turn-helix domain-containing protein [Desulfobulbus sp.]